MSTVFISHSSADNGWAKEVAARLKAQNHTSVFLDLDPEQGIVAGRSWERTLYRKLRACRAVIALCTDSYLKSQWCFAEIALARMEGKPILAMLDDPLAPRAALPSILTEKQFIDLRLDREGGYKRLWRGLDELELLGAVGDWDPAKPPYLGLSAYHEEHAPIFFGREAEIRQGVELLDRGAPGMVMVLGTSGSGKSSLARAGVVPRLRRSPEHWLIADPFRPGRDPFGAMAQALAQAFQRYAPNATAESRDPERLRQRLLGWSLNRSDRDQAPPDTTSPDPAPFDPAQRPPDNGPVPGDRLRRLMAELEALKAPAQSAQDAPLMAFLDWSLEDLRRIFGQDPPAVPGAPQSTPLTEIAYQLRRSANQPGARLLLVIDQFEELLGTGTEDHGGQTLLALLAASQAVDPALITVFVTMRSDFFETFQTMNAGLGLDFETMSLGPIPVENIRRVIEAPAKLGALELEPGLADALLKDAGTPDALPLLSFTLWRMCNDAKETRALTLEAYRGLGGLKGAIAREADAVLRIAQRADKEDALRQAFRAMVRLASDGQFARKPVAWDNPDLVAVHDLLDVFIERRLLVTRAENGIRIVEVAHESLFRAWTPLRKWTEEQRADLVLSQQLQLDSAAWTAAGRKSDYLWRGARLAQALDLLNRGRLDDAVEDAKQAKAFVKASEALRRRQSRRRRILVGAVMTALIGLMGFAVRNEDIAKREQRASWSNEKALAAMADLHQRPLQSIALARQAVCLTQVYDGQVLAPAHHALNQAVQAVHRQRSLAAPAHRAVTQAMFLPLSLPHNGLLTLGQDRVMRYRPLPQEKTETCSPVAAPLTLGADVGVMAIDPLDRFVAFASAGTVALMPLDGLGARAGAAAPVMSWPSDVTTITIAPDGSRLAAVDQDGAVLITPLDASGRAQAGSFVTPLDKGIATMGFTADGSRLATAGWAGTIELWDARTGAALARLEGHSEAVTALSIRAQTLASASWDKTVRIWDLNTGALRQTLAHDAAVSALTIVARPNAPDMVISASWDGSVRVWDIETGAQLLRLEHGDPILSLSMDPRPPAGSVRIATGGWDGKVHLWTVGIGRTGLVSARLLAEHKGPVNDLDFSPDGQSLASASDDATVKLTRLSATPDDLNWQSSLDLRPSGDGPDGSKWLAVMLRDGVEVLDAATGRQKWLVTGYDGIARRIALTDEGGQKLVIEAGDVFEFYLDSRELLGCADRLTGQPPPPASATLTEMCRSEDYGPGFESLLSRVRSAFDGLRGD